MSERNKKINSYLNDLPAVNNPYADTAYMVSVDRGGVAKIPISYFLNNSGNGNGESGSEGSSSVGDVYGLKNYSLSWADGTSNHYMSEVKELIETNGGDITKLNYVGLQGHALFIKLTYVGGKYQVYAFDIFNLKTYEGQIDLATTTVADFLAYLSAAEEDSTDSSIVKVEVNPTKVTSLVSIREAITSAGKTPTEPNLVHLQGPTYNNFLNIWFVSNGGDSAYVYCWDLTEGKFYRTDSPALLPSVIIGDFLSATYEAPLGNTIDTSKFATKDDIPSLDGYAKTSDLFSKNYNDLTNKPTIPSIAGLATEKYVDDKIRSLPSGGGSGGGSIIPVDALPTENIDANAIYKVSKTDVKVEMYSFWRNEIQLADDIFEIVDTLPETGTPCLDFVNNVPDYWYYQKSDGAIYGYADDTVASEGGVPVGWYPIEMVYEFIGDYKEMISSTSEITEEGNYALVTNITKPNLYYYDNGVFVKIITEKDFEFDASTGTLVLNL